MRPRTSKPLVGILGDVDGRIVPVAPPPFSNLASGHLSLLGDSPQSCLSATGRSDGITDGVYLTCRRDGNLLGATLAKERTLTC